MQLELLPHIKLRDFNPSQCQWVSYTEQGSIRHRHQITYENKNHIFHLAHTNLESGHTEWQDVLAVKPPQTLETWGAYLDEFASCITQGLVGWHFDIMTPVFSMYEQRFYFHNKGNITLLGECTKTKIPSEILDQCLDKVSVIYE